MEFRVLGGLEVWTGYTRVLVPGARRQRVLAALLLAPNSVVPLSRLVDVTWDEEPPSSAVKQVRNCVSALRERLSDTRQRLILTEEPGYRICVDEGQLDSLRFAAGVADARRHAADGELDRAVRAIQGALGLWRGPALDGLGTAALSRSAARWDEQRLSAVELCAWWRLDLGQHHEVVADLTDLVHEHPLREGLHAQLMVALERCGRRADALTVFHRLRTWLAEELGVDPGADIQRLHERILRGESQPRRDDTRLGGDMPVATPSVVPRQLPAAPGQFVGREDELRRLGTLDPGTVTIIAGAGGIGKTWLALHWAHRHADRFPDGQLFVDLRGFSPDAAPMDTSVALRGFLDALGVDAAALPATSQAQAALLRSLLADRRMLVVLDNAGPDTGQVTPLLPGGSACALVVTSRQHLPGLIAGHGARHLTVDVLSEHEAVALLTKRLGVAADSGAVTELVSLCGRHPLALSIIASLAHTRPDAPLALFVDELREFGLRALDGDDAVASLPTVISWSRHALPPDQDRLFLPLALAPGAKSAPGGKLAGLPSPWTTFVGRRRELVAVRAALDKSRLVTLVGPGGVGKTRLAAVAGEAAAADFPSGGAFVDLVPVGGGSIGGFVGGFVTQAVASALGVTERPQQPLEDAVHEHLRWGRSLIVLDNCEHLLDPVAGFTGRLLASCPDVTVLATSRERLGIAGERVIQVPPLSLASEVTGGVPGSEAEELFLDRARAIAPDFDAEPELVDELCARLDGMPLAIELAAARIGSLGIDGLVAGLTDRLRILAGGRTPADRHQSLRAVLDWSHNLLDGAERTLFHALGVYAGGFDRDAAAAVSDTATDTADLATTADLVGRLADKSLLTHLPGPRGSRWRMLETVRAYALEHLAASGAAAVIHDRHLRWAARTADRLERQLEAGQPWRDEFDVVADDLRAALDRAPAEPGDSAVTHRLARSLGHLAYATRFLGEARHHYEAAAARAPDHAEGAADLRAAADVACAAGRYATSFELLLAAADRAESAGDDLPKAIALADAVMIACRFNGGFPVEIPHERLRALLAQARRAAPAGDPHAHAHLAAASAWTIEPDKLIPDSAASDAALVAARAADDPALISCVLDTVLSVAAIDGQSRRAFLLSHERLELLDRLPRHDPRAGSEILDTFQMATKHALMAGALPAALAAAQLGRDDAIGGAEPYINASRLLIPLILQGRFDEALDKADAMREEWQRAGRPTARWLAPAAYALVLPHGLRADTKAASGWAGFARQVLGTDDLATSRNLTHFVTFVDARVAMHAGRIDEASALARAALGEPGSWYAGPRWDYDAYAWAITAELAVLTGAPDAQERLAAAAPAGDQNDWAAACLARAHGLQRGDRSALERSIAGWDRINARFERACTLLLLDDRATVGRTELAAIGCPSPSG